MTPGARWWGGVHACEAVTGAWHHLRMSMRSLRAMAERPHGLVTTTQLRRYIGESRARTGVRRGWLVEVRPHVYRLSGVCRTWRQAVCAATLIGGPRARASHVTAAALWAMPGFPASSSTPIELTVPRGRRPQLPKIPIHQSTILSARHVARVDDVRVTSVARTLCDLDGRVPPDRLGDLVDEMLTRRAVTIERLRTVHGELRHGRRWSRAMGEVLAVRGKEAERADSGWEARIVRWLREAGFPEPVQQHEIAGYHVDLAYPDRGVLIEFDGFPRTRRGRPSIAIDTGRTRLLLATGAVLLRFTSVSTREEVERALTAAWARAS